MSFAAVTQSMAAMTRAFDAGAHAAQPPGNDACHRPVGRDQPPRQRATHEHARWIHATSARAADAALAGG